MMKRLVAMTILLLASASATLAAGLLQPPVTVDMNTDAQTIAGQDDFDVTITLSMESGWHVYSNDSTEGKPTAIELILPQGFTADDLQWPPASELEAFGGEKISGYEGVLKVKARIHAPKSLTAGQAVVIKAKVSWLACSDECVPGKQELSLTLNGAAGTANTGTGTPVTPSTQETPAVETISWTFLASVLGLALIGGILLNCMPCVLPVLSIKVLGFVQQAKSDRAQLRRLGLAYTAGTEFTFLVMALVVIGLRALGHSIGWGFQFQHPMFLIVMSTITTTFALSLFGLFDVDVSASGELEAKSREEGLKGSFMKGVLATMLSTPCTAPFLGPALGFAFSQPAWVTLAVFLTVGFGLALPLLLLNIFPGWLKYIPKPGEWMNTFKQSMGFLMLATTWWLLSVVGSQLGTQAYNAAVLFLVALAAGVWLWSKYRHSESVRAKRVSLVVAVLLVGVAFSQTIYPSVIHAEAATVSKGADEPEAFSEAALNRHLDAGEVVLVDFTATWCLTCQYNEKVVLHSTGVMDTMNGVKATVLKADWTNGDPEITRWLNKFGRSGVPLYVVFSPHRKDQPIVLPEVVTQQMVIDALKQAGAK